MWKETLWLRLFGLAKVPFIYLSGARVIELSDASCRIGIPFRRRNKNHLGSMYFGVLCIGADVAGGIIAARLLEKVRKTQGAKGSLIFKDFQAKFLKRAEGDTVFSCQDGLAIEHAVRQAFETSNRIDVPVKVIATVPEKFGTEPVAEFILTLSLKVTAGRKT